MTLSSINLWQFVMAKTLAFFVGAFYAGVAGGLWAYYIRYVGADQFTLWYSVWPGAKCISNSYSSH